MRIVPSIATLALGLAACASDRSVTRLGDGHYRVQCDKRLFECLEPVVKACEYGYTLVTAEERRELAGPAPNTSESFTSSAEVRCRRAQALFTSEPAPSAAVPDAGAPAPSAAVSDAGAPAPSAAVPDAGAPVP